MLTFDPAGVNGLCAGSIGAGGVWAPTPAAMDAWGSYSLLYQNYRVNWIRLRFRFLNATTSALAQEQWPVMYSRFMYDPDMAVAGPTLEVIEDFANVVCDTFSSTNSAVTKVIYPRVMQGVDFYTTTSLPRSYRPVKMPWTDVTRSVQLYGFMFNIVGIPAGYQLLVDVTYKVQFKNQR